MLLVGIILINGCAQQKGEDVQELPSQEESKIGRPEQAGIFLKELGKQCRYEIDLLFEAHESTRDKLLATCDNADRTLCIDEIGNRMDKEGAILLDLCSSLNKELLDKGQYTDVDLTDLYEELSNELSTTAQEGRLRIISKITLEPRPTYEVTSVIDGDTIEINTSERVRLIGINAPEEGEKCYEESKEYLENFLSDKEITLERDMEDKDQYDRLLRYVFADGHNVNYGMVYLGFAHKYEFGSNTKYSSWFEEAENEAKQNEGCLWKLEEVNYIQDKCIYITNLHFNAAGDDNYNLNDEYVTFGNKCSYSIDMGGWTIKDETASHIYTILAFTFQSGATFTLYTGSGTNTNSALYWGRTSGDYAAIWNNGGDTLFLRDSGGNLVLSQSYSGY